MELRLQLGEVGILRGEVADGLERQGLFILRAAAARASSAASPPTASRTKASCPPAVPV